jgi:hypothetical protein
MPKFSRPFSITRKIAQLKETMKIDTQKIREKGTLKFWVLPRLASVGKLKFEQLRKKFLKHKVLGVSR